MSLTRRLYDAWRQPLPPRGHAATAATLGVGILAIGAVAVVRDPDLRARIALSGMGLVVMMMGITRPRFAWKFDQGWRWVLGDRGFVVLNVGLGVAALVIAWLAPL